MRPVRTPPASRRRPVTLALTAALLAAAGPGATAAAGAPRVTVFGDSVQASFGFVPQAPRILGAGLDLRVEASVCRRLTGPGCLGGRPPSARVLAGALGPRLGELVVVNVGYNDSPQAYDAQGLLRALGRARVRAVVWVTLRESQRDYARINARIRAASRLSGRRGYPLVRVVDWNAASRGRAWFASDGIHLNPAGAVGLARLLRGDVVRALGQVDAPVGGTTIALPVRRVTVGHPVRRLAGDRAEVWAAGAGRVTRVTEGGRRNGRPLAPGGGLAWDGRRAWLLPTAGGTIRPAGAARPRIGVGGPARAVAGAGPSTWFALDCPPGGACPAPGGLLRVGGGPRATIDLPGATLGLAGSPSALWVALSAADGPQLQLRAPRSGRLVRTVPLGEGAPVRGVAASARVALVLTADGRLRLVSRGGRTRVLMRGVSAVTGDGRSDLWALQARRGHLVWLHPVDGRVLARAVVGRRSLARPAALTLTGAAVWVTGQEPRGLLRVPRR